VAELLVDDADLLLHLTRVQVAASFHRDIRVPLTAVRSVSAIESPWMALRGRRMAGSVLRGVVAMGTWTHSGGDFDFCILRGRDAAVQVDLNDGRFARYLVGTPDLATAQDQAARLAEAAGIRYG
jgi:hypothetical protein